MEDGMNKDATCGVVNRDSIPELRGVVNQIAHERSWREVRYEVSEGSKSGDNFVGVVNRVTLTGKSDDGKQESLSLICKSEPESKERQAEFRTRDFFPIEALFYNDILPSFKKFQTERGLPASKHFSSLPTRCYLASNRVLILDDMCTVGFTMRDRREALDWDHCRHVVTALGQFHAISFALRDQEPQEFRRLTSMLKEPVFVPLSKQNPKMLGYSENFLNTALAKYKEKSATDSTRHERLLHNFRETYYASMQQVVRGDAAEPYAVINHGDCWTNNILFQTNKETSKVQRVCFLDYQLGRYASPATDLSYFFFTCTDKKTRDQYYDQLIILYHRTLLDFLREVGSDPEILFPFEALQNQLKMFSKFGLGMAVLVLPLFTIDPENALDIDESPDQVLVMKDTTADLCWTRMNEVIDDMVDRKYLN